jgi:transcriptional regulator with XRE-family HTH domain
MREAADLSGVKIASWSDIETGNTPNPGILTCQAMARALGVSLDVFAELLQNSE